ncbi:hypothetical protein Tco_0028401, partial [Tanacetum coccineum]
DDGKLHVTVRNQMCSEGPLKSDPSQGRNYIVLAVAVAHDGTDWDDSIIRMAVCDEDDALVLLDGVHKCSRNRAYMFSKRAYMFLQGYSYVLMNLREKVKRAHMFFEECTRVFEQH